MAGAPVSSSHIFKNDADAIQTDLCVLSRPPLRCLPAQSTSALPPRAFRNAPPSPPLYKRKSYKALLLVLLVIALIFFSFDATAAIFMIISVLVALFGSYSNMKSGRKVVRKATNMVLGGISKTMIGTQGGGLAIYALSFFLALNNRDDDEGSTSYQYSG